MVAKWGSPGRWLASICCLSLLLALSSWTYPASAQRAKRGADEPAPVTLTEVKVDKINQRIGAVGSARAQQQVTLTTRVSGVIEKVLFKGGQIVESGEPLVKLISDPEQIAVETAEAQRGQANDTVERYKQLSEGTVSKVTRAEADTALKVADATLRKARDDLDRMTLKAPFKGMMGLSTLQAGDYLAVGSPIATIDDRSSLLIEFTVPEAVASAMTVDLPVRANPITRSGEIYNGRIAEVGTRIDPVSRTLIVRAEIPNPDLKLIPGSTFSVAVRLPGQESPLVPALAIQWDRGGAFVWRVTSANAVERVPVAILDRDGDNVHIDAKLAAGDKVVNEGGGTLQAGQTVKPQSS